MSLSTQQVIDFSAVFNAVTAEVKKNIFTSDNDDFVKMVMIALFSNGHVLLEGLPGMGKTTLVKQISKVLGLKFGRIQFTPDLMPMDVTGSIIIHQDTNGNMSHEFDRGPIFCNLLLADEINRATPKTQSSMLEVMAEKQITNRGVLYRPGQDYSKTNWPSEHEGVFNVLATQNPIEHEGVFPLPEAQLDRFFFKLHIPYPSDEALMKIIKDTVHQNQPQISSTTPESDKLSFDRFHTFLSYPKQVVCEERYDKFAIQLVRALHAKGHGGMIKYGPSPRGVQTLLIAAKTLALTYNRSNVSLSDIKEVACPALRHRLILSNHGMLNRVKPDTLIKDAIHEVEKRPDFT